MTEMLEDIKETQSFVGVKSKVAQIVRWWDLTAEYLEKNSTKLPDVVNKILKASVTENPFPEGMDMNWALDVQSAQTLDFFAGVQKGKVAWDLGTLTGVSAAVLSQHMKVTTVERETSLVNFARKHLPENVEVVQSEIEAFLQAKAAQGETAANAAAMDGFLGQVRADTAAGKVRSLMMPVRD